MVLTYVIVIILKSILRLIKPPRVLFMRAFDSHNFVNVLAILQILKCHPILFKLDHEFLQMASYLAHASSSHMCGNLLQQLRAQLASSRPALYRLVLLV